MRIPVALYPYCSELLPFVKHFEALQKQYSIKKLISPMGLNLYNKDAAYARNHPDIGIIVSNESGMMDQKWEILLLNNNINTKRNNALNLESIMEKSLTFGKKVCYFDDNYDGITNKMLSLSNEFLGRVFFHVGGTFDLPLSTDDTFVRIETPLILVGGLLVEADVLDVLMCIAARLRSDGMRPLVLSRHKICEIFDFHSYEYIFRDTSTIESRKILELNKYLIKLIRAEMPDVILAEAPDAVMRFNSLDPNGFGIRTYMFCQAIEPDLLICCIPYGLTIDKLLNALSADLSLRIGSPIFATHVSNLIVDANSMLESHKVSYAHDSLTKVNSILLRETQISQIPLFNTIDDNAASLYNMLHKALYMK